MAKILFSNDTVINIDYPNGSATLTVESGKQVTISRDGRDSLNLAVDAAIENVRRNSNGSVTVVVDSRVTQSPQICEDCNVAKPDVRLLAAYPARLCRDCAERRERPRSLAVVALLVLSLFAGCSCQRATLRFHDGQPSLELHFHATQSPQNSEIPKCMH